MVICTSLFLRRKKEDLVGNLSLDFSQNEFQPLAARMRYETLEQYITKSIC